MRKIFLPLFLFFLSMDVSFAKNEFIPIDPHGGNSGAIGREPCFTAMKKRNKEKVMGYIAGYLAGVHSEYWLNKDLTKSRYKSVSSDTSIETIYLILNDMCVKTPYLPLFDMMNPLRNKLIQIK